MKKAFVLINCDLGKERDILTALRDMNRGTWNLMAYDIVAEDNAESLRKTIILNIRKLPSRATLSLVTTEGQN